MYLISPLLFTNFSLPIMNIGSRVFRKSQEKMANTLMNEPKDEVKNLALLNSDTMDNSLFKKLNNMKIRPAGKNPNHGNYLRTMLQRKPMEAVSVAEGRIKNPQDVAFGAILEQVIIVSKLYSV